jgi:hypothetical protein
LKSISSLPTTTRKRGRPLVLKDWHDLPHVGDPGILQKLQEGAVVDVAVGVDIGETQMLLGDESVDPSVRQVETHVINAPGIPG